MTVGTKTLENAADFLKIVKRYLIVLDNNNEGLRQILSER